MKLNNDCETIFIKLSLILSYLLQNSITSFRSLYTVLVDQVVWILSPCMSSDLWSLTPWSWCSAWVNFPFNTFVHFFSSFTQEFSRFAWFNFSALCSSCNEPPDRLQDYFNDPMFEIQWDWIIERHKVYLCNYNPVMQGIIRVCGRRLF